MPQLDEGRVPAADGAAQRGVARRGRSPESPRRRHPARGPRDRRRRAPHRARRAHRGSDAAHAVGRAGDAERRPDARSGGDRRRHAGAAASICRASPSCSRRRWGCASTRAWAARRPTSRCGYSARTSTSWRGWPSRPSASWRGSPGVTDLRAEALTGLPQLQVRREPPGHGARRPGARRRDSRGAGRPGGPGGRAGVERAAALRPGGAAARRSPRQPGRDPHAADRRPRRHQDPARPAGGDLADVRAGLDPARSRAPGASPSKRR